jgi:dTMP kinase
MRTGFFISLEGPDGGGKGTQSALLMTRLAAAGYAAIKTREPGGTNVPEAETLRDLAVRKAGGNWTPTALCMLMFTARHMHTVRLIEPALAAGQVVVSERFADSTYVYQCLVGGVPLDTYRDLYRIAVGTREPDLTLILDVDGQTAARRMTQQILPHMNAAEKADDRFEAEGAAFQTKVRAGYLQVARENPKRCVIIDASQPVDKVAQDMWNIVEQRLNIHVRSL